MASSLVKPGQRSTNSNVPEAGASRKHPVLADYESALARGDPRAQMASQILQGRSGQPLQTIAMNMLQQRGLTPEAMFRRFGLR